MKCLHLLPCFPGFVGISLFVSFMKTLFFMLCLLPTLSGFISLSWFLVRGVEQPNPHASPIPSREHSPSFPFLSAATILVNHLYTSLSIPLHQRTSTYLPATITFLSLALPLHLQSHVPGPENIYQPPTSFFPALLPSNALEPDPEAICPVAPNRHLHKPFLPSKPCLRSPQPLRIVALPPLSMVVATVDDDAHRRRLSLPPQASPATPSLPRGRLPQPPRHHVCATNSNGLVGWLLAPPVFQDCTPSPPKSLEYPSSYLGWACFPHPPAFQAYTCDTC